MSDGPEKCLLSWFGCLFFNLVHLYIFIVPFLARPCHFMLTVSPILEHTGNPVPARCMRVFLLVGGGMHRVPYAVNGE